MTAPAVLGGDVVPVEPRAVDGRANGRSPTPAEVPPDHNGDTLQRMAVRLRRERRFGLYLIAVTPLSAAREVADDLAARITRLPNENPGDPQVVDSVYLDRWSDAPIAEILERAPDVCKATAEHPQLTPGEHRTLFVFGLDGAVGPDNPQGPAAFSNLNLARDHLRGLRVPTVFWVSPELQRSIAWNLKDFWNWVAGSIELEYPPAHSAMPGPNGRQSPPDQSRNLVSPGANRWLTQYLHAHSVQARQQAAEELLTSVQPAIQTLIRHQVLPFVRPARGGSSVDQEFAADCWGEIRLRLLQALEDLRTHSEKSLDNFPALARTVAKNFLNDRLRARNPRRTSLANRVRYMVESRRDPRGQPLYALWEGERAGASRTGKETLIGLTRYAGRPGADGEKLTRLRENPDLVANGIFPDRDPALLKPPELAAGILCWLDGPVPLNDLVGIMAHLQRVQEPEFEPLDPPGLEEDDLSVAGTISALDVSPEDQALSTEFLREVWTACADLPRNHRTALLLNPPPPGDDCFTRKLPALGIATLDEIAESIGLGGAHYPRFLELWDRLPLDDREIAVLLGVSHASVRTFRARAYRRVRDDLAGKG